MAANIFSSKDYTGIINRINELNAQSERHWGKMSLTQMLEHCSIQLKIGLGIISETAYEGPSMFRNTVGRWVVLYAMPWPKGAATPTQMNMLRSDSPTADFQDAKQVLLELLKAVQTKNKLEPHPFFGDMERKDWGRLIWKHLDHHLRQFGN